MKPQPVALQVDTTRLAAALVILGDAATKIADALYGAANDLENLGDGP